MEKSKSIGAIVGPTLLTMVSSELKIWNGSLYDDQIVPLVYLSGVLIFVAGISIVRSHNIWVLSWPIYITIIGWLGMLLGTFRMFFPQIYKAEFENDFSILIIELVLIFIGLIITYKSYWPQK